MAKKWGFELWKSIGTNSANLIYLFKSLNGTFCLCIRYDRSMRMWQWSEMEWHPDTKNLSFDERFQKRGRITTAGIKGFLNTYKDMMPFEPDNGEHWKLIRQEERAIKEKEETVYKNRFNMLV